MLQQPPAVHSAGCDFDHAQPFLDTYMMCTSLAQPYIWLLSAVPALCGQQAAIRCKMWQRQRGPVYSAALTKAGISAPNGVIRL